MRGALSLIESTLLLGSCTALLAQEPAPAAETEIVRLDVVVTDARGEPAGGLARGDFEVREDGKPQRISDFVFLGQAAATQAAEGQDAAAAPAAAAPGAQATLPRQITIVVDEPHLSRRSLGPAKEVLRRFVKETAAADDRIALVVIGRSAAGVSPTWDRGSVLQAIERLGARGDWIMTGHGAQLTPKQAELILLGDLSALELGTRTLTEDPGQKSEMIPPGNPAAAESRVFRGRNASSDPTPVGIENDVRGLALDVGRQAEAILAHALTVSEASLDAIVSAVWSMAPVPGQKTCLLVSEGFLLGRGTVQERTRGYQQVIDAGTRSGVTIYAVVPSGLVSVVGDASVVGVAGPAGLRDRVARAGERLTIETLERMTDDTGGLLLRGGDDLAGGLARVLRDREASYLLAYEPTNRKRDGRFRKIDVRLPAHSDLRVRTRRGYFAPDRRERARRPPAASKASIGSTSAPAAPAGPQPLGIEEARLALAAPLPKAGLPVRVAADYVELTPGRPQAVVKARVDPKGLSWTSVEGRRRAEFDLVGGVFDASGRPVVAPFVGQHYALDVTPAEYDALERTGVGLEAKVFLRPGRYEVRVLALDAGRAPLGGAAGAVEVPDLSQKQLTLSGVFVSSLAAGEGRGPGGATNGPRDAQVLRRFEASDSLFFQLYVYNAARDASGKTDVVLQSQILAAGRPPFVSPPVPVALEEKDGVPLPVGNGVPLLGLSPGSYELRLVVVDRVANLSAARRVEFSVVE